MEEKGKEAKILKKRRVEVPAIWNKGINTVAKKWLIDEEPEKICPIKKYKKYLSDKKHRWYCVDICYQLFISANMRRVCPCKILELDEIRSKVEEVIHEWERRENERKKKRVSGYDSLDSHFAISKIAQEMVEAPGPSSERQEVARSIINAENR